MTATLVTTCGGFSQAKVGGRCSRRDECQRFIERKPHNNYPQEEYLCSIGKWDWFFPANKDQSHD